MQIINDNTIEDRELLKNLKGQYEIFSLDDFRIIFFYRNQQIKRAKFYHKHSDYEFVILLTTIKDIILDGKRYIGETDTIYPISPNRLHGIDTDISDSSSYIDICIENEYFNKILRKMGYPINSEFNYEFPFQKKLAVLILRFSKIYKSNNPFKFEILKHLKELICEELIIEGLSDEKDERKKDYVIKEKFNSITSYIATNYNNPKVVENAAKLYNYTTGSLSKLFAKHYNIPINQFILKTKLSNAKMLLKYSELSIEDIAKECGFKGLKYFSEIFIKKNNISPSKYRKDYKGISENEKSKTSSSRKYIINDEFTIYSEICYRESNILYKDENYSYFLIPLSLMRINQTVYLPKNLYYFEANQNQSIEHIRNSTFYVLAIKKDVSKDLISKFNIDIYNVPIMDNTFINYIEYIIGKWNDPFKAVIENTIFNLIKNEILYAYIDKTDLYYEELKEIVYNNLGNDNIAPVICDIKGYNKSEFNRRFFERFKITPYQFLIHCRLTKAKELLEETDLNIEEIAEKSGFSSTTSLIYHIKEKYNITPAKYREKHNSKKQE